MINDIDTKIKAIVSNIGKTFQPSASAFSSTRSSDSEVAKTTLQNNKPKI